MNVVGFLWSLRGARGVFVVLLMAVPIFGRAQEIETPEPVGAASLRAEIPEPRPAVGFDFYSEAYRFPVSSQLAVFERLRLGFPHEVFSLSPYLEVNQEKLGAWSRVNLEGGLARAFAGASRFTIGVSRRGLDHAGSESSFQVRSGLSSGALWRLRESGLFAESYAEGFAIAPAETKSFLTGVGWLKLGLRSYERHHVILDPVVLELRGAGNSDHGLAGPSYLAASLGPRLSVWMMKPALRASLFVSRSWVLSSSQEVEDRPYWFLVSLGGEF